MRRQKGACQIDLEHLAKINGIHIDQRPEPANARVAHDKIRRVARWRGENPTRGDMWLTSWGNGSLDPFDIMEPTLVTGARGNSAGYSNAEVDALIASGDVEMDPDTRAGIYQEAQVIVNAEAPWVFLWLPQDIYGVSSRLKGWQPSADSRINLHRAYLE